VIEYRPAHVRPLAEVLPGIETKLRAEQSARLLTQQGEATIQTLKKGEETGMNWSAFQVVGRQPSAALDAAAAKAVFRVGVDKLPAYTGFVRPDGSYRIVRVSRVLDTPGLDARLVASIEAGVMQAQQQADMQAMLALVKAGQKVEIQPNAIEGR
jgi:peptidyl-prolyl cis-trans isomerase D